MLCLHTPAVGPSRLVQHPADIASTSINIESVACRSAGVYAGLRASGNKGDLSLVVADAPAIAAGAFTQNVMCAAPVTYCKEVLSRTSSVRAVGATPACD